MVPSYELISTITNLGEASCRFTGKQGKAAGDEISSSGLSTFLEDVRDNVSSAASDIIKNGKVS